MSSEVKRYDPINSDGTCGMCIEDADYGAYVEYADYSALKAERERLRAQVSALQSDANSWQSGYDKGREDGAKAAEGWKAQHARDSAELRRLCSERDEQWRIRRDVEADRDTANAISAELRAERDALAAELAIARRVIGRIGQLCTTPHESKERFIRRVQSVIEWERAAQQEQPQ